MRATVPPAPLERDLQGPGPGWAGFGGGMAWAPIAEMSMLGADVCELASGPDLLARSCAKEFGISTKRLKVWLISLHIAPA